MPAALDAEVATAFADAGAAALDRLRVDQEHERQAAQQRALTRAAKTLNESLDLDTVLARICHEAATILDADIATVYRGNAEEGVTIAAAFGIAAGGGRLQAARSAAGWRARSLLQGRAMLTNDYQRIADLPGGRAVRRGAHALAAPMVWDGELRGVLSVGYMRAARRRPRRPARARDLRRAGRHRLRERRAPTPASPTPPARTG